MSTKRDYYEILGVSRDAENGALKSAYRKLALQYHPDRNPNDAEASEKFKECSEAYAVLSKPELRREYDRAFFRAELERVEKEARAIRRRKSFAGNILVAGLGLIVAVQAGVLLYLGGGAVTGLFDAIVGGLF